MCAPSLGSKVILWYLVAAALGIGGSIWLSLAVLNNEYANSPANSWLLIGGVTSTSISFRVRLADDDGNPLAAPDGSTLVIAQDADLQQIVSKHALLEQGGQDNPASNEEYGIHSLTVPSLSPQNIYYYGVVSSQYPTGTLKGKFQTPAPEGTAFSFTIAASSCAWTGSRELIFDYIRQDHPNLQLFVHMGDFHYENINGTNIKKRLDAVSTVLNSEPQAELFRSVPLAYTWDDHDYLGNQQDQTTTTLQARDTARLSYRMAFPHYPLARQESANETNSISPLPIYQAFTIGTVRFIVLDLQSDKQTKSIYSAEQKEWLFQELERANQFDYVVLVSSKPWIGMQNDQNKDDVFGSWIQKEYQDDRADLSSLITEAIGGDDGPQNLIVLAGDAHMVAFDSGENTYYGNSTTGAYSFPLLQSAALDNLGSSKGGPYSEGCQAIENERTHQYSTLFFRFEDVIPCIQIESFRVDEWGWKDKIFERTLCGKIFAAGKQAPISGEDAQYCSVQSLSEATFWIYIIAAFISLCLAFGTCIVIGCQPGSDQTGFSRASCGLLGVFIAWLAAATIVSIAVIIPVANNVSQYDLRSSFAIAICTLALMSCALFIIFFCCSKPEKKDAKTAEVTEDVELGSRSAFGLRPCVVRMATNKEVSEDQLPDGVILTGGKKLHSEGLNGTGVKVAVIDSGIDQEHPGFKGQVKEQNWLRAGTPLSEDDHGTHVAGTVHLMAPKAEIYDYRVFGKDGTLGVDAAIAKSIRLATDSGCQVINMSLGGPFPNDTIWEAVQYASSKGVLMVCAAGNEGDNNPLTNEISFPASYKECISVAAVSSQNGFPVAVFSNSNPLVDVAGVGVDVVSFKPGGGYQKMSGTSMASPHVAGLIACLLTKGQTKPDKIYDRLYDLAIDIGVEGIDNATGIGFVTYLDKASFGAMFAGKPARSGSTTVGGAVR